MPRQESSRVRSADEPQDRAAPSAFWRTARVWAAALLMAGLIPLSAVAQQDPPGHTAASAVIEALNDSLLDTMKQAGELGYQGRYEKLDPVLRKTYDLPAMAKAALGGDGGYWGGLTEAQRKDLVAAFSRMSVATYADRFDKYSGQRFEIVGVAKGPRDTVLVRTRLVETDGDTVKLNYLMIERPEGWKIIDVFAKGAISEIATKRSDYGAVMKREGFDSLLSSIKAKVAEYEKSS